jgi:protein-S-isoprenylcysteine O-methyltransferase Ste14
MKNPKAKLWFMTIVSLVVIALVLFFSAGTARYWQAWLYLAVTVATSIPLILFYIKNPALIESRTKLGPAAEKRTEQKIIISLTSLPLIAAFIVPALDYRFGWSHVPSWISIVGELIIIISMWAVIRVLKENSFASATVEVVSDQKVISTGPYAIVRNPMYTCAVLYTVGMSLALGSYWGLIPSILVALGFVWRLFDEERFLAINLPGYKEYCAKVRWHLMPGIF